MGATSEAKEQARAEFHAMQGSVEGRGNRDRADKLLEAFPEWRRSQVPQRGRNRWQRGYGLRVSAEEVGQIADHRMIKVLRDAIAYRELQRRNQPLKEGGRGQAVAPARSQAKPTRMRGCTSETTRPVQERRLPEGGAWDLDGRITLRSVKMAQPATQPTATT